MVGWLPKLIYTQTNIAIVFFFLWVKQMYSNWFELTLYMPSTIHDFKNGCVDFFTLHWPLLIFVGEVLVCGCIINGIKKNAPKVTIKAKSTERVSALDASSIFTVIPVFATLLTEAISLQLIFILFCLLLYEVYAFKVGCSNLTMLILQYNEYSIVSLDDMSHRILTKKNIRKGDDTHEVIEFNDIYLKV